MENTDKEKNFFQKLISEKYLIILNFYKNIILIFRNSTN